MPVTVPPNIAEANCQTWQPLSFQIMTQRIQTFNMTQRVYTAAEHGEKEGGGSPVN